MKTRKTPPARSPEARQNQLIDLAYDEAERRLRDGTASSQIITTLLTWASTKAQLEIEKIHRDIELSKAKERELDTKILGDEKYEQVLQAFRSYQGSTFRNDDIDDFE